MIKALEVVSKPSLFLLNIFCVQIILHNTTPFPSKHGRGCHDLHLDIEEVDVFLMLLLRWRVLDVDVVMTRLSHWRVLDADSLKRECRFVLLLNHGCLLEIRQTKMKNFNCPSCDINFAIEN